MELATLDADDWPTAREVRLRALKDSPSAYISEYEDEVAVGESAWRERFTRMRWIVARHQAGVIGLASSVRVDSRPPYERHVESVWVDPRHRRTGILRAIFGHLTEVEPDVTEWRVWVLDTNSVARDSGLRSTMCANRLPTIVTLLPVAGPNSTPKPCFCTPSPS